MPTSPSAPNGAPLLRGVRVLDVAGTLAGPYRTTTLSDLGADVAKSAEGRQIVRELAMYSDVLVENLRAGAMSRLGRGYDEPVAPTS